MRPETLWARCTWVIGTCFRCDRTGLDVASVEKLAGWGVQAHSHACRACVFHLDQPLWELVMRGGHERPDAAVPRRAARCCLVAEVCLVSAGVCCCRKWAAGGVVVSLVLGDSGPGWTEVAHLACAEANGRRPVFEEQTEPMGPEVM